MGPVEDAPWCEARLRAGMGELERKAPDLFLHGGQTKTRAQVQGSGDAGSPAVASPDAGPIEPCWLIQ